MGYEHAVRIHGLDFATRFLRRSLLYHTFCRIIAGTLRVGQNGVVGFLLQNTSTKVPELPHSALHLRREANITGYQWH